jgi:hypothetical protein
MCQLSAAALLLSHADKRKTGDLTMPLDETNPENQAAQRIQQNVHNLPVTSLLVAGLAGAGVMAILSRIAGKR